MSFFGHMLAGTAAGVGQGLTQIGTMMEREQGAKELLREKQAGAMELARQRDQDRADRERDNLLLRKQLSGMGGGGGGKGGSLLENMLLNASTPEEKANAVDYVRMRAGDDAASLVQSRFGMAPAGSVFDRLSPAEEAVLAAGPPQEPLAPSAAPRSADAEKGRLALNRLLAQAGDPSNLKGYAEGESRLMGNDAVRQANETGKPGDLMRANAVNMALEGKDRFGLSDGTVYDKAGVTGPQTTAVGRSEVNKNNAAAGKYAAEAKSEREGGGAKANTLQSTKVDGNGYLVGIFRDGATRRLIDEKGQPIVADSFEARVDRAVASAQDSNPRLRRLDPQELRQTVRNSMLVEQIPTAAPLAPANSKPGARPPLASFQR